MWPKGGRFFLGARMAPLKPAISYDDQVAKLKAHGCLVADEARCRDLLSGLGYFRLSSYLLPFKKGDGHYADGADFDAASRLAEFDGRLRGVLLWALGALELRLRAAVIHRHAMAYGPDGYLDPANFDSRHDAEKFGRRFADAIKRNAGVPFVRHFIEGYGGRLPLWAMAELLDFGTLSYFYRDMFVQDRKAVARALGFHYGKAENWLHCCTDLRNVCAHCGWLYGRPFQCFPKFRRSDGMPESAKGLLWGAVMALKSLFPSAGQWNGEVMPRLEALFWEHRDCVDLSVIAFPPDWAVRLRK